MSFVADLPTLLTSAEDLASFDRRVQERVEALEAEMSRLHVVWTGEASVAHREAHRKLMEGFAKMREGASEMKAAVHKAHANYSAAVASNGSMMGKVG